jgi:hypothetical protein
MPLFETAQHREVEERIIRTAAEAFKCEAAPCSKAYCVDAVLFRNRRAVAFAEARQRKDKQPKDKYGNPLKDEFGNVVPAPLLSINRYPTLTWSAQKYVHAMQMTDLLPVAFCVEWLEGIHYMMIKRQPYPVGYMVPNKVRWEPDKEPVVHIPVSEFKLIAPREYSW